MWGRRSSTRPQSLRYTVAGAVLLAATLMAVSCTPYPMYGTRARDRDQLPPQQADSGSAWEPGAVDQPSTVDTRLFRRVVDEYLGTPYKRGGSDRYGIDCSNLVAVLYREYSGTRVPASTRGLYELPRVVSAGNLAVGDLLFFRFGTRVPSHVGVYIGEGRFVHASETDGVVISALDDEPYRDAFAGARRVLSDRRGRN